MSGFYRISPAVGVLSGQSLWGSGPVGGGGSAATRLFAARPTMSRCSWTQVGAGWNSLLPFVSHMQTFAKSGNKTILLMVGGTSDYNFLHRTGQQVYDDQVSIANTWRSYGGDYVICSTTTPSTTITGGDETARQAGNTLVLANGSNAFDYVVDLAGDTDLSNASGSYYDDGTHLSSLGCQRMADLFIAKLDLIGVS